MTVPFVPVLSATPVAPLHGAAPASTPIPHSLVLVVAVLGLWAAIAAAVAVGDRLLARLGATE